MINFCFDNLLPESYDGYYPNLVDPESITVQVDQLPEDQRPQGLGAEYPFIDYCRLLDYMRESQVPFTIHSVESAPVSSFYPVDITYFDHSIDYFAEMSQVALHRMQQREIKVLFVYCEADNPIAIQRRLYQLADLHNISPLDIKFVLGIFSPACMPPNFLFLDEGTVMYASGHKEIYPDPLSWHDGPRSKKMTYLNRIHKSWRVFFAAWYWQQGYHHDSYFSYCNVDQDQDMSLEGNPLRFEIKNDPAWKHAVDDFLAAGPFYADNLSDQQRNYLGSRVDTHFTDSYWNLSVETFLTLEDDFPGVFITEKTWKPIAQGQPFMVLGNAYTLKTLRSWGFRTYGEIGIDENYDYLIDNTDRFRAVMEQVKRIHSLSWERLHQLHLKTKEIAEHNQTLFWKLGPDIIKDFVRDLTNGR
jgi:hypothetical protein